MKELNLHSLPDALVVINNFCLGHKLPKEICLNINLVCEELIVNLLSYNQTKVFDLELDADQGFTKIVIRYQGKKFDPTQPAIPENKSVEEMRYGGLGLVLVNSLASKINYRYHQKQSVNVVEVIL